MTAVPRNPRTGKLDTWHCVECIRERRPYVYVDIRKDRCPHGHKRKGGKQK